jgi:hypothetical protein
MTVANLNRLIMVTPNDESTSVLTQVIVVITASQQTLFTLFNTIHII